MSENQQRYFWNPLLHQEWGKTRMYFWQMGFKPTYNRQRVMRNLEALLITARISSYAVYEAAGLWDIFLRVWLPAELTPEDFAADLKKVFGDGVFFDKFRVVDFASHWAWNNDQGCLRVPSSEVLRKKLADVVITEINEGNLPDEDIKKYSEQNIISPFKPNGGIKFIATITRPVEQLSWTPDLVQHLTDRIRKIVIEATDIFKPSLYVGEGFGLSQFLLLGRVANEKFASLDRQLIGRINDLGIGEYFKIRTYTYFVINSAFESRFYKDNLYTNAELVAANKPIEKFLNAAESEDLEFKGSARFDIKSWIAKNVQEESEKVFKEGILRSIVALLNTKGGNLIIGVLEKKKFQWEAAQEKLKEFPSCGDNIVFGLESDFKGKDWDSWHRELLTSIINGIEPACKVYLSLRMEEYSGKQICVISVTKPESWFYIKEEPRLYVRIGANTFGLDGPQADSYRNTNER